MARTKKRPTIQDRADLGALKALAEALTEGERDLALLVWKLRDSGVSPEDIARESGIPVPTLYRIQRP